MHDKLVAEYERDTSQVQITSQSEKFSPDFLDPSGHDDRPPKSPFTLLLASLLVSFHSVPVFH